METDVAVMTSILSKKTTASTAIITYVLDIILSLYVTTRVKFLISLTLNFQPPASFIVIILLNFDNITKSFNKVLPNVFVSTKLEPVDIIHRKHFNLS